MAAYTSQPLVLVTGVNGFLGSHVVHQLLEAGYRVRGTARSAKVALAKEGYASYGDQYDVVALDDLIHGDFVPILKGVDAVIHVAAPLAGREGPAASIDAAVEGSMNILREGEKLGIKQFAFASSIITVTDVHLPGPFTDQHWNSGTKEEALDPARANDAFFVYGVEKTLAERAIWEFADQHPHLDVTTVNPPFFIGPFAPGFRAPEASPLVLSANMFIYNFLKPEGPLLQEFLRPVDIRDVARGLVGALKSPPSSEVGRKRILMSGEWFGWKEAAELVARERQGLKDRIVKAAWDAKPALPTAIDNGRAKEVLALDVTPWKVTLLDAVDSLIALENEWKSKGLALP